MCVVCVFVSTCSYKEDDINEKKRQLLNQAKIQGIFLTYNTEYINPALHAKILTLLQANGWGYKQLAWKFRSQTDILTVGNDIFNRVRIKCSHQCISAGLQTLCLRDCIMCRYDCLLLLHLLHLLDKASGALSNTWFHRMSFWDWQGSLWRGKGPLCKSKGQCLFRIRPGSY